MAWENLTLILACSANACLSDDTMLNPPQEYGIPFRPGISDEKPSDSVRKFIVELNKLIGHPWVPAQLVARDALGTELTPKMFHLLFEILDLYVCLVSFH
jgi:hypothetical protein